MGRVLGATLLSLLGLMAIAALVGYTLREPLAELSGWFVLHLGGPGIAFGYFLPDCFSVPIPNDIFGWFGIEGGIPFWEVVAWGTLGSIVGGSCGYVIGSKLRHFAFVERFLSKGTGKRFEGLLRRNGNRVVIIAAITPLPYSVASWAAGATGMPFRTFLLLSTLRIIRVAGSLYLIVLGLLSVGG